MVAALQTGRNSIGIDIDPEYCRMAGRYRKTENSGLLSTAQFLFEKVEIHETATVMEDQALYEVRPSKRKLA